MCHRRERSDHLRQFWAATTTQSVSALYFYEVCVRWEQPVRRRARIRVQYWQQPHQGGGWSGARRQRRRPHSKGIITAQGATATHELRHIREPLQATFVGTAATVYVYVCTFVHGVRLFLVVRVVNWPYGAHTTHALWAGWLVPAWPMGDFNGRTG